MSTVTPFKVVKSAGHKASEFETKVVEEIVKIQVFGFPFLHIPGSPLYPPIAYRTLARILLMPSMVSTSSLLRRFRLLAIRLLLSSSFLILFVSPSRRSSPALFPSLRRSSSMLLAQIVFLLSLLIHPYSFLLQGSPRCHCCQENRLEQALQQSQESLWSSSSFSYFDCCPGCSS